MSEFSVDETSVGEAMVVRFVGSADLNAQAALEREVNRLTSAHYKLLVLDLSQLTFIASLAVGQLVVLHHAVRRWGGRIGVANPTDEVRDVLVRCRLTEMLPMFPSVQEAIDAA